MKLSDKPDDLEKKAVLDKRTLKRNTVKKFLEIIESIPLEKNGCKIWPMGISSSGYGNFSMKDKSYAVHRLVYILNFPGSHKGKVIRHKCDVRSCCNIEHLEIGSQKDNIQDASKRNRLRFGEDNHISIFCEEDVIKIRSLYPQKSTKELANEYNTSPPVICSLISGRTWRHVPGKKKVLRNRKAIGEKAPTSKLTVKQVLSIREEYPSLTKADLAKKYGISHPAICAIINRKTWCHI